MSGAITDLSRTERSDPYLYHHFSFATYFWTGSSLHTVLFNNMGNETPGLIRTASVSFPMIAQETNN